MAQENLVAGRLTLILPTGENLVADSQRPGPDATVKLRDFHGLWMVLTAGDLGFAEAYMAGHFDTPELKAILDLAVANETWLQRRHGQPRAQRRSQLGWARTQ